MVSAPSLAGAFAAALRAVERRLSDGGEHAVKLAQLRDALHAERDAALARGAPDPAWVRRIVRDVAAWAPDDDLTLLAALGGIARAIKR
jgi:hypothetical protein